MRPHPHRRRTNWGVAMLAWMALFALFCLAPSHICQDTLSDLSLCVSGQPPIGMAFMPVRQGPLDKFLDAAWSATIAWVVLMAALVLFRVIWPRKT